MSDEICPRCRSENISIAHFRLVGYPTRTIYCRDCERSYDEGEGRKREMRKMHLDVCSCLSDASGKSFVGISRAQYEALMAVRQALEETQSLLTVMLLERRPESEIETQIAENRTALDRAAGIQTEESKT